MLLKHLNRDITVGSSDVSQYSKGMAQLIHPRGNRAARGCRYSTLTPRVRGRGFAAEGCQMLQGSCARQQSAMEIALIIERAAVSRAGMWIDGCKRNSRISCSTR